MYSVRAKYQYPIDDYLSESELSDYLIDISDDWLIDTFSKYSDTYRNRKDHVTVVSELTNLIGYLEKQIIESERAITKYLKKIISDNIHCVSERDQGKLKKILNGLISFRKIHEMDPEPVQVINTAFKTDLETDSIPVQLFRLIEFILFANTHHRQITGIPSLFKDIQIKFPIDLDLVSEQRERINHQVNKDILDNIVLTYFESPESRLPISINELEERISAQRIKIHGNKKIEYDDATIKEELDRLLKNQRYIHQGKYKGKANVNALSKQLLNTTFRNVDSEISLRQMTRKVKALLPDHLKV